MRKLLSIAVALSLCAVGSVSAQEANTITLQSENQVFGGLTYNPASNALLISSATDGQIYQVGSDGTLKPVIHSDELKSAASISIDSTNNRLYAVSSSFGALTNGQPPTGFPQGNGNGPQGGPPNGTPPAGFPADGNGPQPPNGTTPAGFPNDGQRPELSANLFAFDLTSGKQIYTVDLTKIAPQGGGFIGQTVADASGNVYLTDSAASAVYRIDASGSPTYLSDEKFQAQGMGIRGLAYDGTNLLVSKTVDGSLYRVKLSDGSVQTVTINGAPASLGELAMLSDGRLAGIDRADSKIVILNSTNQWQTAQVSSTLDLTGNATALAVNGTTLYALEAEGTPNNQGGQTPTMPQFTIVSFTL